MDVFDLAAKLTLDSNEYDKGLTSAEGKGKSFIGLLGGGFAAAAGTAATAITAAGATAGAVIGKIGADAVKSYANYEQLVGGVDKLYGDASEKLQDYANEAYKTSGMSANEYMETATSFSAALVNSLGGDVNAAADQTDLAMRAISDNVNTFGSDMESVQNAFQGFAKQNYTMLDNLKLGYGGTKEGMEQLIKDANEYAAANGQAANLTIDSFSDIVTAIDLVQQKQHIAGTTAKEAMTTIEGSATATKAAWENVKTAIAGGGDLTGAMSGLIDSLFGVGEIEGKKTGFLNTLFPVITETFEGVADFLEQTAPIIAEKLPELVEQLRPAISSIAESVGLILSEVLPGLVDVLGPVVEEVVGTIWDTAKESLEENGGVIGGLITVLDTVIEKTGEIFDFISNHKELLTNLAIVIGSVAAAIGIYNGVVAIQTALTAANIAKTIIQAAVTMDAAIAQLALNAPMIATIAIIAAVIAVVALLIKNWDAVVDTLKKVWSFIKTSFLSVWDSVKEKVSETIEKIKTSFGDLIDKAKNWGKDMIDNFINGIKEKWEALKQTVSNVAQSVKDFLGFSEPKKGPLSNFHTYAPDMMNLFAKGIKENSNKVTDAIEENITLPAAKSVNGIKGSVTNVEDNGIIDYGKLANAVALALEKSGLAVEIDNREFGRVVRKVVTV